MTDPMQDLIDELMVSWQAAGQDVVLIDPVSRHQPPDGDVARSGQDDGEDLFGPPPTEPAAVDRMLRRHGRMVVHPDPGDERPGLAEALVAVQVLRTWTGHPDWIVLDDAQDLLTDPDLPPEGLRFEDGGYCLIRRWSGGGTCTILPHRSPRPQGTPVSRGYPSACSCRSAAR